VILAGIGVLLGAIFLLVTMLLPEEQTTLFMVMMGLTGVSMSLASPNVMATVHDITLPEVRSTAQSLRKLFEDGGAAIAPFLAGVIATQTSLHVAILSICIVTWVVCAGFFVIVAAVVPADINRLRKTMQDRAQKAA
jgi:MFS family permease